MEERRPGEEVEDRRPHWTFGIVLGVAFGTSVLGLATWFLVAGLGSKDPAPTPLLAPTPPLGSDPNELAAWTTVARVLLNLDETVTKE
jgi:hypothetical protein